VTISRAATARATDALMAEGLTANYESLAVAREMGLLMPRSINLMAADDFYTGNPFGIAPVATMSVSEGTFTLNVEHQGFTVAGRRELSSRLGVPQSAGEARWWSTTSEHSTAIHELGHWTHGVEIRNRMIEAYTTANGKAPTHAQLAQDFLNRWRSYSFDAARFETSALPISRYETWQEYVATKISQYGASNAHEFVAETWCLLVTGETVPEELMAIYRLFDGPMPTWRI
jgi:hypothetical protein